MAPLVVLSADFLDGFIKGADGNIGVAVGMGGGNKPGLS
jgi:hypothetical protein